MQAMLALLLDMIQLVVAFYDTELISRCIQDVLTTAVPVKGIWNVHRLFFGSLAANTVGDGCRYV